MLTTLLCFVELHILVIGHLWQQHHWIMIWLWTVIGPVGGRIQAREGRWIQARQGECLFLVLVLLNPCSLTWSSMVLLFRWSLSENFWVLFLTQSWPLKSKSEQLRKSRRVGILRKTMSILRDFAVLAKCFWAFILSVLEYSSPACMSAATSYLLLLDRATISQLSSGSISCDTYLAQKQGVISVCLLQY